MTLERYIILAACLVALRCARAGVAWSLYLSVCDHVSVVCECMCVDLGGGSLVTLLVAIKMAARTLMHSASNTFTLIS